jgi:hypothetical protein
MPNSAIALGTDMCTCSEAYTTHGCAPVSFAGSFASRAMASAMRLAEEPPPQRLPAKPGQPTASASQPTTVLSTVVAAGAERQEVTF